ncbi:ribosomal L7Ae/L30e/S12e/Gadd45 family protein [Salimicrobium flavidum]|uniref:Large subunit ribosomal protein L7A n=1 Tax=Salimicrobium flavidum TaxID=570947 RepID=A0A1N7KIP6_9BACI|nr:ribosomal L7Ae/L30e/S12e/Gadd45 family protein [Salimicrobium flavidum]SIS61465.1 large subunit ribosomal protein L7A [Salimicrobium flavidum]
MSYEKVAQAKSNLVIGTKQTIKAIKAETVKEVIIASDADPEITAKVKRIARQFSVDYHEVPSMKELGNACGIDVDAATVAIK